MTTAADVITLLQQTEAEILANYIANLFLKPIKEGWSNYPYSSLSVGVSSKEKEQVVLELRMKGFIVEERDEKYILVGVYREEVIEIGEGLFYVREISLESIINGLD